MSWENSTHLAIVAPRSSGKTSVLTSGELSDYRTIDLDDWVSDALAAKGTSLNEVMVTGSFDKINKVFDAAETVFDTAEIVGMPAGALGYKSIRTLLGTVSIFAFLPGATQQEALDVLVERESHRPHFQGIALTDLQEKVASDLSGFISRMQETNQEIFFTETLTPDEIAAQALTYLGSPL